MSVIKKLKFFKFVNGIQVISSLENLKLTKILGGLIILTDFISLISEHYWWGLEPSCLPKFTPTLGPVNTSLLSY